MKTLIQQLNNKNPPSPTRQKAARAAELNAAISRLWQAQGTHSKTDFNTYVMPMYTQLLKELRNHQSNDDAEQSLIVLLNATTKACHHRWTVRLPMKRPGSDYRKYEVIYTDALVTAMAVGCLQTHASPHCCPKQLAGQILPTDTLAQLQADPIVWEDWLGYFSQAERGGLYAVSICARQAPQTRRTEVHKRALCAKQQSPPPPAGSGRAMLAAIKQALADGSLSVNQPGDAVQVDREGRTFLEHPKILTWCINQLGLEDDLKRTKGRFSRLKVHKRSAQGHQLYFGRRGQHEKRRVGYVLENPAVLWLGDPPSGPFIIEQVTRHTS